MLSSQKIDRDFHLNLKLKGNFALPWHEVVNTKIILE